MVGIKEIAKIAGVSVSTVSNALNGRKNVGKVTRERILQICEEYGYQPASRDTDNQKPMNRTVMFIFSDFDRDFYLKIIEGISDCLNENDYDLMICTNRSSAKFMRKNMACGIISLDGRLDDDTLLSVARAKFPIVLMDRIIDDNNPYIKSVIVDNYPVMSMLVQKLIDRGFRRFGFLGGLSHTLDNKERFAAFEDTLGRNGIPFDRRYYFHGNYRENSGYQAAKIMILSNDLPEVLVCANDNMALGAMKAFEENGIRVPEDISITGFDDSETALLKGLTTISIPRYESGYIAAKELLSMIKGMWRSEPFKLGASIAWRYTVK
jgi:LacI family transcriptional regulator